MNSVSAQCVRMLCKKWKSGMFQCVRKICRKLHTVRNMKRQRNSTPKQKRVSCRWSLGLSTHGSPRHTLVYSLDSQFLPNQRSPTTHPFLLRGTISLSLHIPYSMQLSADFSDTLEHSTLSFFTKHSDTLGRHTIHLHSILIRTYGHRHWRYTRVTCSAIQTLS
jgi:hypothetical protein